MPISRQDQFHASLSVGLVIWLLIIHRASNLPLGGGECAPHVFAGRRLVRTRAVASGLCFRRWGSVNLMM